MTQSPTLFTNGRFPATGGMRTISNSAPLSVTTGKVLIECPVCGLHVLKPAAWVRRPGRSNFFCGKGCADEFRRVRVQTKCVVCDVDFFVTPSNFDRLVCCSRECTGHRKSAQLLKCQIPNAPPPPLRTRANGNGKAKLNTTQVADILSATQRACDLAEMYGVTTSTIYAIRKKSREVGQ